MAQEKQDRHSVLSTPPTSWGGSAEGGGGAAFQPLAWYVFFLKARASDGWGRVWRVPPPAPPCGYWGAFRYSCGVAVLGAVAPVGSVAGNFLQPPPPTGGSR